MEAIYGWVRQMIGCLLLLSFLIQLLPSAEYEKYIRLFAGMILILLALSPLTDGRGIQEKWFKTYDTWQDEQNSTEMEKITRKIHEADQKREELIEEELKKEALKNEEMQAGASAAGSGEVNEGEAETESYTVDRIRVPAVEISNGS